MTALVRAELLKVTVGRTWWAFTLAGLGYTAVMLGYHAMNAEAVLGAPPPPLPSGLAAADAELVQRSWAQAANTETVAATIVDAGSTVGWLLALIAGILIAGREFRYGTAASTFLQAGRRQVMAAKLVAATVCGVSLWAAGAVPSLIVAEHVLGSVGSAGVLWHAAVMRAFVLNLFAFAAWAAIGVALAVLWRSTGPLIAAAVSGFALGVPVIKALVLGISFIGHISWLATASVGLPVAAAQTMISGAAVDGAPPPWVGTVILAGYVLVLVPIAVASITRRDILTGVPVHSAGEADPPAAPLRAPVDEGRHTAALDVQTAPVSDP